MTAHFTSGDTRIRTFLEASKAMSDTVWHCQANFNELVFNEQNSTLQRTELTKPSFPCSSQNIQQSVWMLLSFTKIPNIYRPITLVLACCHFGAIYIVQKLRHLRLSIVTCFVYRAIVTENITVIVPLVCDMVQTQPSPSGLMLLYFNLLSNTSIFAICHIITHTHSNH